jgi:Zn finger protein HypA/HybF involved in hydrogenase expression
MPIKPRPFTFVCGECGWKKTVAPRSDALGAGECFKQCPKCGNEMFEIRAAGWVERTLAQLLVRH